MKKYALFILILLLTLTSCSLEENDSNNFHLEVLPIKSVNVPETFMHGETYKIEITNSKPSSCYQFNDFIYEINDLERTIAVVNSVYTDDNCSTTEPKEITVSFHFRVKETETYLFKFYQGVDEEGLDQYLLVEVPVVEGKTMGNSATRK